MKKNILVLGSGGNASRNYVKSLKLDEEGFIGNVIGADIDPNAEFFSNTDKFYLINLKSKIDDIKNIIISEKIDYIHAQPDSEVLFLAENMDFFKNKTTLLNLASYNSYRDKNFTNNRWSKYFDTFENYTYSEIENNLELFKKCISKNGKAWVRKRSGSGSAGALPVNNFKQLTNWVDYWVEFKSSKKEDFIVSEFLPGKEYAVQTFYWNGELLHFQARERVEFFFARQMVSGQSSTPSIARTVVIDGLKEIVDKSISLIETIPHGIYCLDLKENNNNLIIPMEVNYGRFFTTSFFFSQLGVNTPLDVIKKFFNFEFTKKINYLPKNIYCYRGLDMEMKVRII
tara:strand:+ start:231 stop:1259 length:1029 start_codon:yes stop_codon:yes gene_type:complete